MSDRELMQQALEALDGVLCDPLGKCCIDGSDADRQIVDSALDALRERLAQPEQSPLGSCIACGNRMTGSPEHFVVATAENGVTAPEGYSPQQVKALHPHTVGDKTAPPLVNRIADILVEDHIALMTENKQLRERLTQPEQEPLQWQGLTNDEIDTLFEAHHNQYGECEVAGHGYERAIEAKLKEKNNG